MIETHKIIKNDKQKNQIFRYFVLSNTTDDCVYAY